MNEREIYSAPPINANQPLLEVGQANEIEAEKMLNRLRRRDGMVFGIGLILSVTLEFVRFQYFENTINAWTLRGIFIPVASISWLLAMISSVSMQSSLKSRGVLNPVSPGIKCVAGLLAKNDAEGLRLIRGIAVAAYVYDFVLGMAIGICICVVISN
jgi:hypothetical protein